MGNVDTEIELLKPDKLREILTGLNLSQYQFANMLCSSRRTGTNWATRSVPNSVAVVALLISERPELVGVIRRLTGRARPDAHEGAGRPPKAGPDDEGNV